jgi:DNA invertase Pin-like site-specific DNA recombinase
MERVDEGDVDQVVVRSVSRVARNMRDLQNTVGEIVEGGAALHFVADGLALDPGPEDVEGGMDTRDKILLNVLGLAAELEADLLYCRSKKIIKHSRNFDRSLPIRYRHISTDF